MIERQTEKIAYDKCALWVFVKGRFWSVKPENELNRRRVAHHNDVFDVESPIGGHVFRENK